MQPFVPQHSHTDLPYKLTFSPRRRSIGIKIEHGEVRVSAPTGLAHRHIERFVASKAQWIARHQQRQLGQLAALPKRHWQHGETIYWLGQLLTLQVRPGHRSEAIHYTDTPELLHVRLSRRVSQPTEKIRWLVTNWYKQQAKLWLDCHLPAMIDEHEFNPSGWRVSHYKGKWAACRHNGELSFSWRLFAAPEWVVRYVIIHELCHLEHFNHSSAFWALVARHAPNYRDAEQWLKQHGGTLLNDNYLIY